MRSIPAAAKALTEAEADGPGPLPSTDHLAPSQRASATMPVPPALTNEPPFGKSHGRLQRDLNNSGLLQIGRDEQVFHSYSGITTLNNTGTYGVDSIYPPGSPVLKETIF